MVIADEDQLSKYRNNETEISKEIENIGLTTFLIGVGSNISEESVKTINQNRSYRFDTIDKAVSSLTDKTMVKTVCLAGMHDFLTKNAEKRLFFAFFWLTTPFHNFVTINNIVKFFAYLYRTKIEVFM